MPKSTSKNITIGCAGWTVAKEHAHLFPNNGTHLERYAAYFDAVEINMTFYRLPQADTVAKWKDSVPDNFRFSVKMAREITHNGRLKDLSALPLFVERMGLLGEKHGPLLVQLPPSLVYEEDVATHFFTALRKVFDGGVVFEPRHPTWFTEAVEALLQQFSVAQVATDPALAPYGTVPKAWDGLSYYRLHGSPKMYYSEYSEQYLQELAAAVRLRSEKAPVWVIFDNTASGAAVTNATWLREFLQQVG